MCVCVCVCELQLKLTTGSKYNVISAAVFTCLINYIPIYKLSHAHTNVWSKIMDMDHGKLSRPTADEKRLSKGNRIKIQKRENKKQIHCWNFQINVINNVIRWYNKKKQRIQKKFSNINYNINACRRSEIQAGITGEERWTWEETEKDEQLWKGTDK